MAAPDVNWFTAQILAASAAVWRAHQKRMSARAATARAVTPDIRLARRDPFALRYVALLAFAVALLFGSLDAASRSCDAEASAWLHLNGGNQGKQC